MIDLSRHLADGDDWQAVDAVIEEHFDRERYGCLFIFGDGEIVPFGEYGNPMYGTRKDDNDRIILSDDHYGDFDHDTHQVLDVMVARLPNDPAVLNAAGRTLAERAEGNPSPPRDFVVYGNANWPLSAKLAAIGNPGDPQLRLSEPHTEDDFPDDFFADRNVIINLHGSAGNGRLYWGEVERADDAMGARELVPAMNIGQANAPGAVILSGCCYGALIDGKSAEDSIALRFLANGAEAYVGSTMISYIGPTDETSYGLWGRLFATDIRAGIPPQEAFLQAKREYALSMETSPLFQFKPYHEMVYLGLPPMGEGNDE